MARRGIDGSAFEPENIRQAAQCTVAFKMTVSIVELFQPVVAAISNLIDVFVAGWNAGDGEACGRPFADEAVFTAITGLRAQGRDLIAGGHTEILSTIYRGTQISATVNSINFLRPDVAAVDVTLQFEGKQPFGLAQTSLARLIHEN